jgi:hypothetical protein
LDSINSEGYFNVHFNRHGRAPEGRGFEPLLLHCVNSLLIQTHPQSPPDPVPMPLRSPVPFEAGPAPLVRIAQNRITAS